MHSMYSLSFSNDFISNDFIYSLFYRHYFFFKVYKTTSGERGKAATVLCNINATGNSIHSRFVFSCVRERDYMAIGAPPGYMLRHTQAAAQEQTILKYICRTS